MDSGDAQLVAHTPAKGTEEFQSLLDHANGVADRAECFAEALDMCAAARVAGLYHDLGKANPAFQKYLRDCHREPKKKHDTVDHKGAGALAVRKLRFEPSAELAFVIAGHHGGLPDQSHLKENLELWGIKTPAGLTVPGVDLPLPSGEVALPAWARSNRRNREFYTRMLFSTLVDADALDTEAFWEADRAERRVRTFPSIAELADTMTARQRAIAGGDETPVQRVRNELAAACLAAAPLPSGFFRLTAPTGSGKTRSALSFALEHARANGLRRVISVAPYLSITDQTADAYRALLGDAGILEHHSDASRHDGPADGSEDPDILWRRLATENWDAPIVVTTAVQFFESLFSNRTSKCRKLHRIAKSVVILDEVQTLPSNLLAPMLDMLRQLVAYAGVSVVLSTATQPSYERTPELDILPPITELAPDPVGAFQTLKRVSYSWPAPNERQTWDEIAATIAGTSQILAVFNTRGNALEVLDRLQDEQPLHLSTLLCPLHRRATVAEIRRRLKNSEPCRVIATQVVEAGVDLDFPVVLRAIGPLERIVQAAGRCNREGRLAEPGQMIVVDPEDGGLPPGAYKAATDVTKLRLLNGAIDPDDPETIAAYFAQLFQRTTLDGKKIQDSREKLMFEQVAHDFWMIPQDGVSVIVPYLPEGLQESPAHQLRTAVIDKLKWLGFLPRDLREHVQAYSVTVRMSALGSAIASGVAEQLTDDLYFWNGRYHPVRGIELDKQARNDTLIY